MSHREMTAAVRAATDSTCAPVAMRRGGASPAPPTDRIDPADPTDKIEPAELTDKIEPADPTDAIEPADPTDRMEPIDAMARIEPTDPMDRIEPTEEIDCVGSGAPDEEVGVVDRRPGEQLSNIGPR